MRNVFKGFQVSKMAVPKLHVAKMNQAFNVHHTPSLKRPVGRLEKQATAKTASRPGKNAGIKRGYEVG